MSIDLARELEELKRTVEGHGQDLRVFNQLVRTQLRGERLSRVGVGPGVRSLDMRMPREPGVGHGSDQAFDISAADTLGNVQSLIGKSNVLADPTLESFVALPAVTIGTTETRAGRWACHYVLNSGTAPTTIQLTMSEERGFQSDTNQFNSAMVRPNLVFGTPAANIDVYLYPLLDFTPTTLDALPWLVASVRVLKRLQPTLANWTSITVTLELLKNGAVIDSSYAWDYLNAPEYETRQLAADTTESEVDFRTSAWRWRLKLSIVKPVTGASATLSSTATRIGEPQLHYAYSPDPLPYQPAVANWKQGILMGPFGLFHQDTVAALTGDANDYAPSPGHLEVSTLFLSTNSGTTRNLTGLGAGRHGNVLWVTNLGAGDIVLRHEHASSLAANRFLAPGDVDFTLKKNGGVLVRYDGQVRLRWHILGVVPGGGGAVGTTAKYATNVGDGVSTIVTVTHSLGTEDVLVGVRNAFDDEVSCDVNITSVNTITLGFTVAPLSNSLRCVVIG